MQLDQHLITSSCLVPDIVRWPRCSVECVDKVYCAGASDRLVWLLRETSSIAKVLWWSKLAFVRTRSIARSCDRQAWSSDSSCSKLNQRIVLGEWGVCKSWQLPSDNYVDYWFVMDCSLAWQMCRKPTLFWCYQDDTTWWTKSILICSTDYLSNLMASYYVGSLWNSHYLSSLLVHSFWYILCQLEIILIFYLCLKMTKSDDLNSFSKEGRAAEGLQSQHGSQRWKN